jgi:hypothetical protein
MARARQGANNNDLAKLKRIRENPMPPFEGSAIGGSSGITRLTWLRSMHLTAHELAIAGLRYHPLAVPDHSASKVCGNNACAHLAPMVR